MTYSAIKTGLIALTLALGIGAAQAGEAGKGEVAIFLTIKTQDGQRDALVELWDAHLKTKAEANISFIGSSSEINSLNIDVTSNSIWSVCH